MHFDFQKKKNMSNLFKNDENSKLIRYKIMFQSLKKLLFNFDFFLKMFLDSHTLKLHHIKLYCWPNKKNLYYNTLRQSSDQKWIHNLYTFFLNNFMKFNQSKIISYLSLNSQFTLRINFRTLWPTKWTVSTIFSILKSIKIYI